MAISGEAEKVHIAIPDLRKKYSRKKHFSIVHKDTYTCAFIATFSVRVKTWK